MSSENLKDDENQTNPTFASQEESLNEDIQHQDKVSSTEMVKEWLLTTPCDVIDASPETDGGTTSADLDVERVLSASSQSRSRTSRSSRSSFKRSSATVKAALAKLRLDQAEERYKREEELRKEAELQEAQEIESFRKEIEERTERRRRQAEEFEEKRRRHAEELEKHRHLIEKRRSEAKRERELELLRLRHWHEAAELKRNILDQLSEGKSNITINHTFHKQEGVSSQFYHRSVNVAGQQTAPQRPTYASNEENVRGNQQGEEGDNVGECSKGLPDRTCTFSQRYTKQNPTSHLAQQGSEPRRLEDVQ